MQKLLYLTPTSKLDYKEESSGRSALKENSTLKINHMWNIAMPWEKSINKNLVMCRNI